MRDLRFRLLISMILGAAAMRLLPHPWNVTPIGAMALFGGARIRDPRTAFLAPLIAFTLSQCAIGFYGLFPVVVLAFVLETLVGRLLARTRGAGRVGLAVVAGSGVFYLVTNFGLWASGISFPRTLAGLLSCYLAGVPLFWNTLAGDAFYSALLFGTLTLAERQFSALREPELLDAV